MNIFLDILVENVEFFVTSILLDLSVMLDVRINSFLDLTPLDDRQSRISIYIEKGEKQFIWDFQSAEVSYVHSSINLEQGDDTICVAGHTLVGEMMNCEMCAEL